MTAPLAQRCNVPACQRGVASIALALMLLIMVSVAAITLSRMASSGLSESTDTSLSVAALAAADSALERSAYRLATTSTCAGLVEGPQTIGAPATTQANYQVLSGTGIPGGCRVQVQSYIGDIGNPRVLRLSEGDIAGGVVVPQDFPNPSPAWSVATVCLLPPCTAGVQFLPQFQTAPGSSGQAMVGQTAFLIPLQTLTVTADYTLSASFTASTLVPLPVSLYWRKEALATGIGTVQTISVALLDTLGGEHPVWSEATVVASGTNTGWNYLSGNQAVPLSANGQTINRLRLRFTLAEGPLGARVGAAFDRVQVGGLVAWRELPN